MQVIGGENASDGEYPWMGALVKSDYGDIVDDQFCGCILVDSNWVLTAAHCVDDLSLEEFVIAIGAVDLSAEPRIVLPRLILLNPGKYHRSTRGGDIALIQLQQPIDDIDPIGYRSGSDESELPDSGRIIGWGRTGEIVNEEPVSPSVLQVADVPIYDFLDPFIVETFISDYLPEFIATGSLDPKRGASSGDSGGPLLVAGSGGENWIVAGVDSWGASIGSELAPLSMFTDVSFYSDWIDGIVDSKERNGSEIAESGFQTGVFEEVSKEGFKGIRLWPFGMGKGRGLDYSEDLRIWQDFEFRMSDFESYQLNGDDSITIFPNKLIDADNTMFIRYWESDTSVSRSGPFPLLPYQVTRGSNGSSGVRVFGQNQTVFRLNGLEAGRTYSATAWAESNPSPSPFFRLIETGEGNARTLISLQFGSSPRQRPFMPRLEYDYWLVVEGVGGEIFEFELSIQDLHLIHVDPNTWYEGVLEEGDAVFRRPGVLADAFAASSLVDGDVKIEVDSVFDAEMGIYDRMTGEQIAYYDQGAENEIETLIVFGEDLFDHSFRIYNFDHEVYGSYRFRYFSVEEKRIVPVGTDERRVVTKSDRLSSNETNTERYYEFIEIESPATYSSIEVTIDAIGSSSRLFTGVWDFNLDDYLETDSGGFNSHIFTPEAENRYFIYVSSARGMRNVNYDLVVTGTEIVDDPEDPSDDDPNNFGLKKYRHTTNSDAQIPNAQEFSELPLDLRY